MNNFLDNAIKIAHLIHKTETDKLGKPYILHPLQVMNSPLLKTDEEKAVGVLHDTVESNPNAIILLRVMRIPEVVIEAVQLLTRDLNDTYSEYINKIAASGNIIAIKVKLADLEHNTSEKRMAALDLVKTNQLRKRYDKAKSVLKPLIKEI